MKNPSNVSKKKYKTELYIFYFRIGKMLQRGKVKLQESALKGRLTYGVHRLDLLYDLIKIECNVSYSISNNSIKS